MGKSSSSSSMGEDGEECSCDWRGLLTLGLNIRLAVDHRVDLFEEVEVVGAAMMTWLLFFAARDGTSKSSTEKLLSSCP